MERKTPFLDQLADSKRISGLYIFEHYLSSEEADKAYEAIDSDVDFPWDLKPKLYGEKLKQHAYEYERSNNSEKQAAKLRNQFKGLECLDHLCKRIEEDFDVKVDAVFCNRFQDPSHQIEWHKDTYGRHIMVLSLGSSRKVQFRDNNTGKIDTVEPTSGDVYFMPLRLNDTHKHRVCAPEVEDAGTRMSFVFFLRTPKYARDFNITNMDKVKGYLTFVTGIGA